MTVFVLTVDDCESTSILGIYQKKEDAVKALFEERGRLLEQWKEYQKRDEEWCEQCSKENNRIYEKPTMYQRMIDNLSNDDYENWSNFPHDCLHITPMETQ